MIEFPLVRHMRVAIPAVLMGLLFGTTPAARANASKPLAPLTWFLGQWNCQGSFSDGKPIHSTETFSPMLGAHWLRMRHHDHPPHSYDAVEWWGHDPATGDFIMDVYDNAGGVRHYTASGWVDGALNLKSTATKGYVDRFVFRRLDDARYQVTYDHKSAPGRWKRGDALICTRTYTPAMHP